jgi:hypothetical protein
VLEALREGGPTKRAGAGRRLELVFVILLKDIVDIRCYRCRFMRGVELHVEVREAELR